jgi:PAS domain S-box-containing protein
MEGGVFHLDDITEQRAAKRALRKERDRFATLFHNLPTPVVHGRPDDGQVRVQAVNERFADVFGYEPDDIQGEPLQDLIVPEEKKDAAEAMPKRLLSGEPVNREERRRTADGLRDFRIQVALREGKKGPTEGFAIYTDVTERKERARMLARRKAILEAQAEATLDGLLVVDTDRRVVFFNDRFLDVWNVPAGPLNRSHRAVPFEEGLLEEMSALLPDPEAFRKEVEYLYDHPDKENRDVVRLTDGRWVDRYSAPIRVDDGDHFGRLWVFRDVTKQRQMMTRLLEVQEEERRRIDQEIHDEMGGLLTSLQFAVDLARRSVQGDGTPTDHFDQMEDIVSELSAVSRTISRKLYPNALSKRGLAEAFPDLIDKLEEEYHLDLDYYSEIEPGDRFSVPIERTMYWIVQETLMGIARRGDVDTAQVIVNERGEQLYLHIFDEGEGLSASARGKGRSFRFEAIRQRVEWLDGEVRVDSIPDEGTRLSVTLPIRLLFPTSRRTG